MTQKSFSFVRKFSLPLYFVSAADGTNVVKVTASKTELQGWGGAVGEVAWAVPGKGSIADGGVGWDMRTRWAKRGGHWAQTGAKSHQRHTESG